MATLITKNSSTASSVPTNAQLVQGELAVNVTDKRLYTENASGTVVELGTNPGSAVTHTAGTAGAPAITTTGDTNTGIFFPAADTIAFSEGGVEAARFDSSGNLGLGTTSPTAKLDVSGTAAVSGSFAVAGNNISAVNSMGFRNRIINGDMRIDQRNAGASVSNAGAGAASYIIDRWGMFENGSMSFSAQQSTTAPSGFTNSFLITVTTSASPSAATRAQLFQNIEGFNVADLMWGTSSAQSIIISFWVRSSLTGTFGGALGNDAGNRAYPFTYTISSANTFERKTITISGDTTGTWITNNGLGLRVYFDLGMGSDLLGTAGAWAAADYRGATGGVKLAETNGATFYITGVQLEAGSVATPFERRDYGRELIMCQRYFTATEFFSAGYAGSSSAGWNLNGIPFPVPMRVTPSVTFSGMSYGNASAIVANVLRDDYANATVTATVAGQVYAYGTVNASAEL
jgi:hypothetical protein